jgi:hypothetical protein
MNEARLPLPRTRLACTLGVQWLIAGAVSGAIGSVLFGVVDNLSETHDVQELAVSGLMFLGAYLSSFWVWLPVAVIMITPSLISLARQRDRAHSRVIHALILTICCVLVALVLDLLIPFSRLLIFAFLWFTTVPPIPFVMRSGGPRVTTVIR